MNEATQVTELSIESLIKTYGRRLGLRMISGEAGKHRTINSSDVHRPGLTLTGFLDVFTFQLVQILGNQEMEYLRSLTPSQRRDALDIIYQFDMPCVIVTGRGRLLPEIRQQSEHYGVPLLRSEYDTTKLIHLLHFYLDDVFAQRNLKNAKRFPKLARTGPAVCAGSKIHPQLQVCQPAHLRSSDEGVVTVVESVVDVGQQAARNGQNRESGDGEKYRDHLSLHRQQTTTGLVSLTHQPRFSFYLGVDQKLIPTCA